MNSRTSLILLALVGLWGCDTLDTADQVHDLRMLGLKAEPPEQVFAIPLALLQGLDAGAPGGPGGVDIPRLQPVVVTGLVADPAGAGRPVHYKFATCAQVNDNARCEPGDDAYQKLAEGDLYPRGLGGEVQVTLQPTFDLILAAQAKDAYRGFGFLPIPVQLTITAGEEKVVGFKRLLFTAVFDPRQPPPAPNVNPVIPTVAIGGHTWAEDEVVPLDQWTTYQVSPAPATGLQETYNKPTFDGAPLVFKENWRYAYFASGGAFSVGVTGGANSFTGDKAPIDSLWAPNEGDGEQDVTFWVVVRDGRGGENWVSRKAHFAPPK